MLTIGQLQLLQEVASNLKNEGKRISESNIRDSIMKDHFNFPEDWPSISDIEDFVARQQSA